MSKLLILDGNSVLHRAYYALPDWRNRSGEATAGVYGFLSMLLKAIEELKPTHLAVVFDCPEPTFRHNMYVGYQTNREKDRQISEDIWGQVEKLKTVFEKMGVPVYAIPSFEADDVIGTIAKKSKQGVIIITGDRDLMQLVDDNVSLYMPQKGLSDGIIVDRDKVKERLGVWPEQVVDYKALVGDSSDNYPGVVGIGPKTAVKLLENFKTFENVVKKSGNQKVIDGYEGGELSKRLAEIRTDAPVRLDRTKCEVPSVDKITEVFKELGYKSLVKRMTGEEIKVDTQGSLFERVGT
ncbi:hypothetical protein A2634_02010 [Candidatus Amesbacteria bacterium RIFCSPHIGHO2_01_FULL_48_32]|uniref:5'-3' exonuclease domain-containing protein n=1 Tax=Candidatus Amesbacteria bacterium RIFCSPLOWO2_01_FULL_48_25 TaxID=1797259 RepID=A0A1F4ZDX4_9BACT|nr:MAG: hypothetical protein A2634_02010 [Candidatus Amesbacteria bacterium RIFCSPHIGHO2_01_FULL_48_32]OGD04365.1 MAG: hypothetical protein A2989_05010 [Candidatus Amesbacteria bacterium RIFCSPLOWO2_01_FULL_48_25]HJZ06200.1 5'-3' exonuclease H3TH domain-containing protein [Patescibacteria group bacterium]